MTDLRVAHTADLSRADRGAIRALLEGAFTDDTFTEDDHEHALGGLHAQLFDGDQLVAHGSVVMRRLLHQGRALRTGYVEAVAVRPDVRRRGHAGVVLAALEQIIARAYDLGALSASEMGGPFYAARGWQVWRGTVSVLTPDGMKRTPEEEGSVYVLPGATQLVPDRDLACDWRAGDPW